MASITGIDGCVKIAGGATVVVAIKEWSLDHIIDMFDITEFADTAPSHKTKLAGLESATGSFSGNVTDGSTGILGAITVGTALDLHLISATTDMYDIPVVYPSDIVTGINVDGEATVSCNFQCSGTITPSFS